MKVLSKSEFIKKSIAIHGNKYDYSQSEYINSKSKISIICNIHGAFTQRASNHIRGIGCYYCRKTKPRDSDFIRKAIEIHGDKYDYSKVDYNGSFPHVTIICKKHGEFSQSPANHLTGRSCDKCARESTRIGSEKIEKMFYCVHGDRYDYSLSEYSNLREKITIICKKHGIFRQATKNHILGQGCPKCGDKFGIKENIWLDSLNIKERQVKIGKFIVDGLCRKSKTIYEFNGDFWHGNPDIYNADDINIVNNTSFGNLHKKTKIREEYLADLGYNIISIWENDFNKNRNIYLL